MCSVWPKAALAVRGRVGTELADVFEPGQQSRQGSLLADCALVADTEQTLGGVIDVANGIRTIDQHDRRRQVHQEFDQKIVPPIRLLPAPVAEPAVFVLAAAVG